MKLFSVLILSLFLINCGDSQSWGNSMKAEGPVVTQSFDLDNFTGVSAGVSGDVTITKGSQQFEVTAAQNIIDNLDLSVRGGILYIGFKKNVWNVKDLSFNISIPSVHYLGMTGSGKMKANGFDQQRKLEIKATGSGSVHSDSGAESMTAKLSGSGDIYLSGMANDVEYSLTGSGSINAKDLKAQDVSAKITGSGGMDISCQANLNSTITGSGSIDLYGSPNIKSRVTGSGKVQEH